MGSSDAAADAAAVHPGAFRAPFPGIALDDVQARVSALPADASGVVLGAAGTGKSAALVGRVRSLVAAGVGVDELLVITPSRQTATALRDRLAIAIDEASSGALARSMASFAFQIVRAAEVRSGAEPPQLLAAGDHDRILADLLAGDIDEPGTAAIAWPPAIGPEVRSSRQFRGELRQFIAVCTELGLESGELARLAADRGEDAWAAAASFLREYRDALAQMSTRARDAADLLREAATVLLATPGGAEGERLLGAAGRLRAVVIDDAQELTRGGIDVVAALRSRGVAVIAFGDPDIASGAFRGASPEIFAALCDLLGTAAVLDAPHRASGALTRLTRVVTSAIGAAGRVEHRRAPGPVDPDDTTVRTIIAASPFEEIDAIARVVREWHLIDEVAWSRIGIIAHDTRQVAALESELAAREVPTRAAGVQRPLGSEPVVRDLLALVALGLVDAQARDPDEVSAVLVSPFGGLDAVGLRRLRGRLRHAELADGGARPARVLLAEAVAHPLELAAMDTPEARAAERLATTLAHLSSEAARGATVHELLWLAWERARDGAGRPLSRSWHDVAVGGGPLAAEVGHALDALVALFDAAKRFLERDPAAETAAFIRRILDSDVPEDILASPDRPATVTVLTPATALGAEFDAVVIAGVQDGVWPNLRLRGGLLDTWRLADETAAWRGGADAADVPAVIDRRRGALHDELRLFARAVSRARAQLVVTAVDDDDLGPSPLFALLPEPEAPAVDDVEAGHPLTLRGLVSQHRRTLTSSPSSAARTHAAEQLVVLARERVTGAAPTQWFGVAAPSSTGPLRDPDRSPVPVSPSKMSTFADCPLDWAVRALGGETRSWSAGAGVILHAALEEVPSGELEALRKIVDDRWGELDFEAPWLSRKEHVWAHLLTDRLHAYLARFHAEGGRTIGAEARFRLAVDLDQAEGETPRVFAIDPDAGERPPGRLAMLTGSIDRVEVYPPGRGEQLPPGEQDAESVVIVDLKTGRSEARVSDEKVADDPQLSAYQLALVEGLVPGTDAAANAGARLIVLSKTTAKSPHYRLARQAPMATDNRAAFLEGIVQTARAMASDRFDAPVDAHCSTSRFGVCALHTVKAVSSS
ncbi:PD-(D/E)XK nuclease family protein [Microbacterium sp. P04]|uniref:PD-(D/E)XK nuclease family protein n=1 Tax=Microbacterium sp. P04 TaxID=3366947 RepID=UPI003744E172